MPVLNTTPEFQPVGLPSPQPLGLLLQYGMMGGMGSMRGQRGGMGKPTDVVGDIKMNYQQALEYSQAQRILDAAYDMKVNEVVQAAMSQNKMNKLDYITRGPGAVEFNRFLGEYYNATDKLKTIKPTLEENYKFFNKFETESAPIGNNEYLYDDKGINKITYGELYGKDHPDANSPVTIEGYKRYMNEIGLNSNVTGIPGGIFKYSMPDYVGFEAAFNTAINNANGITEPSSYKFTDISKASQINVGEKVITSVPVSTTYFQTRIGKNGKSERVRLEDNEMQLQTAIYNFQNQTVPGDPKLERVQNINFDKWAQQNKSLLSAYSDKDKANGMSPQDFMYQLYITSQFDRINPRLKSLHGDSYSNLVSISSRTKTPGELVQANADYAAQMADLQMREAINNGTRGSLTGNKRTYLPAEVVKHFPGKTSELSENQTVDVYVNDLGGFFKQLQNKRQGMPGMRSDNGKPYDITDKEERKAYPSLSDNISSTGFLIINVVGVTSNDLGKQLAIYGDPNDLKDTRIVENSPKVYVAPKIDPTGAFEYDSDMEGNTMARNMVYNRHAISMSKEDFRNLKVNIPKYIYDEYFPSSNDPAQWSLRSYEDREKIAKYIILGDWGALSNKEGDETEVVPTTVGRFITEEQLLSSKSKGFWDALGIEKKNGYFNMNVITPSNPSYIYDYGNYSGSTYNYGLIQQQQGLNNQDQFMTDPSGEAVIDEILKDNQLEK